MSITVSVPTQLRVLTQGSAEVIGEGETVARLLSDLEQSHPGLWQRILDEEGRVRRFVNLYVDEEDVRFLDGLETKLPPNAKLSIIPAVAGG